MPENERCSYEWTLEQAKKANDKRTVDKLVEIGRPPYTGDWQKKFMTERRLLAKYGGEVYGNSKGAFPLVAGCLLRSTEYTVFDKVNFFRGIFATVRLVWPELMTINLKEQAPSLNVPVYFVLGKHDHEAPSMLAGQYFAILEAPRKELIWFENSGHLPNIEEKEKFTELLVNIMERGKRKNNGKRERWKDGKKTGNYGKRSLPNGHPERLTISCTP